MPRSMQVIARLAALIGFCATHLQATREGRRQLLQSNAHEHPHPMNSQPSPLAHRIPDHPMDGLLRRMADGRTDAVMQPIFGASHASNMLELPDGGLLLVWFSNGQEGGDGVGIVSAVLPPGALQWSKPQMVSSEAMRSAQNPVAFYERSEDVVRVLHTSQVAFTGQETSEVRMAESYDHGLTWQPPKVIFSEPGAFVKNNLIRSRDGREWLLPMYYTPHGFFEHSSQYSAMFRSSDGGKTWRQKTVMDGTLGSLVQPTVVRMRSGALRAWFRSRNADNIYSSDSTDDGFTWSHPVRSVLPNNNSGIQACMLASGAILMVFNNLGFELGVARVPLTAALSLDEGATWPHMRDLEPDVPGIDPFSVEYSYPSVLQTKDGSIHISYTFKRVSIRYAKVSEDWIRAGPPTTGMYKGSLFTSRPAVDQ